MTYQWKPSFSVNVEDMDHQHREFISLLMKLSEIAERQNINETQFRELHRKLAGYADRHFQDEERLLAAVDYPELDQQKRHHQFFLEELARLEAAFSSGEKTAVRGMVDFLRDWLFSHILMEDRKYAEIFSDGSAEPRHLAASGGEFAF